jgi:hypothetical protein
VYYKPSPKVDDTSLESGEFDELALDEVNIVWDV